MAKATTDAKRSRSVVSNPMAANPSAVKKQKIDTRGIPQVGSSPDPDPEHLGGDELHAAESVNALDQR